MSELLQQGEIPLVPLDRDDPAMVASWVRSTAATYLMPAPTPADIAWRLERTLEHRIDVGRDEEQVVAAFRSFDTPMSLPGETSTEVNAISGVVVLPTHRRRRLLSRWMTQEMERAKESGLAASILMASEAQIYGRYGFGVATSSSRWTVDARLARWRDPVPPHGALRLVQGQEWASEISDLYDRARDRRPGAIGRGPEIHRWIAGLVPGLSGDESAKSLYVLHRDPAGRVDGSVVYSVESSWLDKRSNATLTVHDLVATSQEVEAALLRYCCEVDLVETVAVEEGSAGDALPWLLQDPRAASSGPARDGLWARIHDVPAAMGARRYPVPGRLRFSVQDPAGQVDGTYLLEIDSAGTGRCSRDSGEPELTVDVQGLAGLWLAGGESAPTLSSLLSAGRATVTDPSVLARAHALFSWPLAPRVLTHF